MYGYDNQDVYCELCQIIDDNSSANWVRNTLMECLPTLSQGERQDLLDEFLDASDEELADLLRQMATSPECDDDWDDSYNDH